MQELVGINVGKAFLDEGLGTAYEHFVKRRYLTKLIQLYNVRLALEASYGNGHANSLVLSHTGCKIVLMNKLKQNLKAAKSMCDDATYSLKSVQFLEGDLRTLPLNSNTFDLVWNSGDLVLERPLECIHEMARVSKRFVLVFVPNRFHIGDLFFRLYLRLTGPQSQGKHRGSMTLKTLSQFFRKAGLTIVERGGIDMPLWPSHLSLGSLMGKSERAWNWAKIDFLKLIRIQSVLEESLPKSIKAAQAHVVYVLGAKT